MAILSRKAWLRALTALGFGGWASGAWADYALNMKRGVTPVSHGAYDLHMLAVWICVGIGIVVFGAILWSVLHFRKSQGAVAAHFHENTALEIVWTLIPLAILVALAIPATRALVAMNDTSDADVTIKVTGLQWRWRYDYIDDGIGFVSNLDQQSAAAAKPDSGVDPSSVPHYLLNVDNPVVVPTGKKVRFLTTAADVIHSWWVPELGFKKDAIPGFVNEIWARIDTPGTYRGQCAELCGVGHAYMPIVLIAKSPDEYEEWLEGMKAEQAAAAGEGARTWTREELMETGEEVYLRTCAACHQANGEGVPGVFKALKGSEVAIGPMDVHLAGVMDGKPGTAMQAFASQLSDAEIAAVITYERNSWGNDTGDMLQPSEVAAARK